MSDDAPFAYSVAQLARAWAVSSSHVYELCASGRLGHLRIGALIRIRQADREAYEARQWHAPGSPNPTTDSSGAEIVSMSAGGRTARGSAVLNGERRTSCRATIWLAQFRRFYRGTPTPPEQPTISLILDGYLADRKPVVRGYGTLEASAKAPATTSW